MAAAGITEDYRCGYCFEDFNSMTDPTELPCHHVFCKTCLEGDSRDGGAISCPICNVIYGTLDLAALPIVSLENDSVKISTLSNVVCDKVSCEEPAVNFCGKCEEKICENHKQFHDQYFGDKHTTLSIDVYQQSPGEHIKLRCMDHDEILSQACATCAKLVCFNCQTIDNCEDEEESQHNFQTFANFQLEISSHYVELQNSISEKLTKVYKQQKQLWQHLDDGEMACENMMERISRVCEERILEIKQEAEDMKRSVSDYRADVTTRVENRNVKFIQKKAELEDLRRKLHSLVRQCHITERIAQKQQMTQSVKTSLDDEISANPGHSELISTDQTDLGIILVNIPESLDFVSEHDVQSSCYSAFYEDDGMLMLGTHDGVKSLSKEKELTKYPTQCGSVSAVTKLGNQNIVVLHRASIGKTYQNAVDICLPGLQLKQTLFRFDRTTNAASKLAVSDTHLIANDVDKNELIIYDLTKKSKTTIASPFRPICGLCFFNESNLLLSGGSQLVKYRFEDGNLTEIWRCADVLNGHQICTDGNGLIYVCAWNKPTVYIISPDGQMLRELTHPRIPTNTGMISVRDGMLAVPGWADKKLHLFKINR